MYNANNYGYNPYNTYMPQRPIQQVPTVNENLTTQLVGNVNKLNGRQVDSIETARIIEYPLDGSTSYYPLTSGEAIVTKQLQIDGTSKIVIFKPVEDTKPNIPKYLTKNDVEELFDELGINGLDDIKNDIESLKTQIKDIRNNKPKKGE